jgi:hypothetical protein
MQFKYVITSQNGIESPILFDTLLSHSLFAALNPVAAGFVTISHDSSGKVVFETHGESIGLNISSRPHYDCDIICKRYNSGRG